MSTIVETAADPSIKQDQQDKHNPALTPYGTDKEGRLIVRNIAFDLKEKHLLTVFSKYGPISNVHVPIKNENNLNRGFGFVEFSSKEDAEKAITEMNGQKFKGRPIAVEFSVPKKHYESRVTNILSNTNMEREDVVQPSLLKQEKLDKEAKLKEKSEKREKQKQEYKLKKEDAKSKEKGAPKNVGKTLFVRNVGYDTNDSQLKEFFIKFGHVKYAVLCKVREPKTNAADGTTSAMPITHKGTGFVCFTDPAVADEVLGLSKTIEGKLDEEWTANRKKNKKNKTEVSVVNSNSLISGELELNGRRLVIMEAMSRDQTTESGPVQKVESKTIENKSDKRNLHLKTKGLVSEANWVHKQPELTQKQIDQRAHLAKEKETALDKNTNLFISKTRISLRNLPKREFYEKELKELMNVVAEEWLKTKPEVQKADGHKKKWIKQIKVLRDKEKQTATGESLASGIGFTEFENEDLALFAIYYLNNMTLLSSQGLIVDYSLEDARQLHKRDMKQEKQKQKAKDKKREDKQKSKKEENYDGVIVDLGKNSKKEGDEKEANPNLSIDKITDIELLHKLMRETNSRGKKQRIKKRIDRLTGVPSGADQEKKEKVESTKQTIKELLKKRDEKLKQKGEKKVHKAPKVTDEERDIMKKIKGKKKENRRQKSRETDEFDDLLSGYKAKFLKKFKSSVAKAGKNEQDVKDGEFEEVIVDN